MRPRRLCSTTAQPYCDGLALHALRLFAEGLPRTQAAPGDLAARLLCQQASWLAASTIGRVSYGASHGIGHALGAVGERAAWSHELRDAAARAARTTSP